MQEKTQKPGFFDRWYRYLFRPDNLRSQLRRVFVTVVLFVVVLLTASAGVIGFQGGRDRVVNQLETISVLSEAEINTWVQSLQTDLAILASQETNLHRMQELLTSTGDGEETADEFRINLENMMEFTGRFSKLFLLDTEGKVVVSTDPDQEGKNFNQESFFRAGLDQQYLQPPRYYPALNETAVFVSQPVYNSSDLVVGVLAGQADLDQLSEFATQRYQVGDTGETYLVGANNVLLTPLRAPEFTPKQASVSSFAIDTAQQDKTAGSGFYLNYEGVPVVGVYRWLPELQVALISEQSQTEAFTIITATLLINVGIAIGALIVAAVAAIWVTRNITRPLTELAHSAAQVAAGKLDLQADTSRPDEIGELSRAFNEMTTRLRHSIETLEDRVRERTQILEIESEISSRIITILDVDELLQYVVDQIQTQFQFYHTHIYLLDETSGNLVMTAGYGEVGRQLKAREHRLAIGTGIVGQVAANNQPFVSNNVNSLPNFVHHLLLPDTQSELAVPLRKGNKVFGVLDLQCAKPDRFSSEDVNLMQSLANITAVALDNARLLAETKHALQQVERLNRRITRESWDKFAALVPAAGYHFKKGATVPLTNDSRVWLAPMKQAVTRRQLVKQNKPGNGNQDNSELAIPLVLRDQVIGVLGVKREAAAVWADEEVAAVEAVADQVARALENARLSQEQEKTIEQLKELDRLKSEFLTSMSHELRTPLNSIIGFADVLLQGIDGDLPELAMHDIQLIYNSGQHLLALINDVLDLSKIEAERMELLLEEVGLHEIVTEVLASTASLVQNKPVALVSNVDQELPLIKADKLRLYQILINLISNAAKFTEEGTITITADLLEDDPTRMRVSVIDTGIGIALDKQPTVFDRFHQADSSTSRKYGGSGLGLAICKRLVEMHGGEIGVSSIENQGSEFYFTIPLA